MENILPVLLIVGGLIYKIYQNYQEEMEKAKKRQQGMPKSTAAPKTIVAQPRTKTAKRRETVSPIPPTPEPIYDRKLGRPKPTKIVRRPVELPEKMVLQHEVPTEVSRMRAQRAQQKLAKKIEVVPVAEALAVQQSNPHFDLRQAVIHAAILERPYAD